ncbi:YqkE family protein [Paenibacillus sp. GCM10028914]|uniref:YqkE family protein n=1 Tax=Paenibacillus sp. GCM10028914 TaxID=3273416 RepID=UPI00361CA9B7
MAKKKGKAVAPKNESSEKPATLKDLLNPQVIEQLKAKADSLKADEAKRIEEERLKREEARKAEQKKLDNDFGHLLENSGMDWRKFK